MHMADCAELTIFYCHLWYSKSKKNQLTELLAWHCSYIYKDSF